MSSVASIKQNFLKKSNYSPLPPEKKSTSWDGEGVAVFCLLTLVVIMLGFDF